MPAHRIKIAFITNGSARKRTFRKRMQGLNKKLSELSTLCGIDACGIIYSPYEPQPEVWPSQSGVQQVLAQFLRLPEKDQFKKMINQHSYMRERITKAHEELKKQKNENWEEEMKALMYQCLIGNVSLTDLNIKNLNDLGMLVVHTLSEVDSRIQSLKKSVPADPAPQTIAGCGRLTDHLMARREAGHEPSLKNQPVVGIPETMDGMQYPTCFMDLLMGSK